MPPFLAALLQLCRLNGGPQDLPSSQQLMIMTVAISVITKILPRLGDFPVFTLLFASVIKTGLMLGILYLILKMNNKTQRFIQTATAICGVLSVIQIVTAPLFIKFLSMMFTGDGAIPQTATDIPPEMASSYFFWMIAIMAVGIWSVACVANIMRHALEVTLGRAVFITMGIMVLSEVLTLMIAAPLSGGAAPAA